MSGKKRRRKRETDDQIDGREMSSRQAGKTYGQGKEKGRNDENETFRQINGEGSKGQKERHRGFS